MSGTPLSRYVRAIFFRHPCGRTPIPCRWCRSITEVNGTKMERGSYDVGGVVGGVVFGHKNAG